MISRHQVQTHVKGKIEVARLDRELRTSVSPATSLKIMLMISGGRVRIGERSELCSSDAFFSWMRCSWEKALFNSWRSVLAASMSNCSCDRCIGEVGM